jgi:hypothetical protein
MIIPRRYITVNTNVAWKLEGCQFQSIDLRELAGFISFQDRIQLQFVCEDCGEASALDMYPLNNLSHFIWESNLTRYINQWAKYKCKMEKYTIKKSKREVHTNIIYGSGMGFDDEEED